MKILHTVEFFHPSVGGMQEVVKQLSERLVRLGHEVTVATTCLADRHDHLINGVKIEEFSISGNAVTGIKGDVSRYESFLLESHFDIVANFAAQQWATDIALMLLPRIAGRKVFVPTGFSGLHSRSYRNYFSQLPKLMRCYDMNVFLSDSYRDISFARKHGITKTALIPNGAAADEFLGQVTDIRLQLGVPTDHFMILHVGSHTGLKGHEETIEIFRQADIRDATLLIIGNDFPNGCGSHCLAVAEKLNASVLFRENGKRIIVTTLARHETVSAYHAADLFLFPSNIECSPIVLFECMASRTPFLVTEVGNSAEIIGWSGGAGILLPSKLVMALSGEDSFWSRSIAMIRSWIFGPESFSIVHADITESVSLLEALYCDPDRRNNMVQAGFMAWQKRFTWESIAGEYEALYRGLVEGKV